MFSKVSLAAAAALGALTAIPAAAEAQSRGGYSDGYYDRYESSRYDPSYDRSDRRYADRSYDRYDRRYADRSYDRSDRRYADRSYDRSYGNRSYGYDDRGYADEYRGERRCSGTTGTIVGGVAGALAGRAIDRNSGSRYGRYSRRGSGTTGTIIGGALGALAGRAVDKSGCRSERYRY